MTKKTAIVFGGSRGIGAASVRALSEAGFDVGFTYVSQDPGEADYPTTVRRYKADICDPAAVAKVFADVAKDFGGAPTCVVANAGINVPPGPLAEFDPAMFRKVVEVNLVGAFNVLAEAARQVVDGGTIIALTTSMVRRSIPNVGAYTATKGAVECLVRSLSMELAGRGVRVNAVAPGPIDTDLFRAGKSEQALKNSAGLSPLGRVGESEEVAEVVAFLASDKASWVLGQIVQPNGGLC